MTANTSRGYPYPQLTDTVDQLAAYIQALAEAINTDVGSLATRPRVSLVGQTAQSIAHNSATAVQFGSGSEILDTANWHDMVTNNTRVTPNIEGWYEAYGAVALGGRTDYTNLQAWFRTAGVNAIPGAGKPVISATQLNGTAMIPVAPRTIYFNGTTDYIELMAQHVNGASAAQTLVSSFQFASILELKLSYR